MAKQAMTRKCINARLDDVLHKNSRLFKVTVKYDSKPSTTTIVT